MTERQTTHKLVRVDQVMQLYARLPVAAVVSLILGTILLFYQRPVVTDTILFGWWGLLVGVTALRLLLVFRFRRITAKSLDIETWAARFLVGTVLAGLAWGAAGFFLFPAQGLAHQLVLVFTMAGLASAAVTTLGSEWKNISLFLCLMLVPVILRFVLLNDTTYVILAVMTLIYLIALLLIARSMHNTILEVLNLRTADIEQEAKLLESEEKYRNVVERSNDGIGIIQDGKIKYLNERLAGMAGYTAAEILGTPFSDYIHPEELPTVLDRYKKRMAGKDVPSIYETVGKHKDGRKVPMELNVGLISYHNKPAELVIVRDITERNRTQEALRKSEETFRNFIETSADLVFRLTKTGYIEYVSPMVKNLYGYSPEDLIGKHLNTTTPIKEVPKALKALKTVLKGKSLRNFEINQKTKNGKIVQMEVNALPVEKRGKIVGLQGIMRDITERKQMEEQIRAALNEKEILLKEIHHRVKNNLQVVSSLLSLQSRYTNDQQVVEVFRSSQERIRAMAIAHEKLYQSEDLTRIDFREYIGTLTTYLFESHSFKPGQIEIKNKIEDIFMNLETAIPLGLVINELVSNSLKHAFPEGKKGELLVLLRENKDRNYDYTLVIRDNGVGLPEDFGVEKGGSLGMVLVNTLVRQLHGIIEHETKHGACFTIKFNQLKH